MVRLPGTVIFTPLLPFRPVAHLDFPLTMKGGVIILCLGFGWGGNASRQKGPGQSPGGQWTSWPTAVFWLMGFTTMLGLVAQPVCNWGKASLHTVLYILWVSSHFLVMSPIRQNYRRAIKEKMKINRFGPQLGY